MQVHQLKVRFKSVSPYVLLHSHLLQLLLEDREVIQGLMGYGINAVCSGLPQGLLPGGLKNLHMEFRKHSRSDAEPHQLTSEPGQPTKETHFSCMYLSISLFQSRPEVHLRAQLPLHHHSPVQHHQCKCWLIHSPGAGYNQDSALTCTM